MEKGSVRTKLALRVTHGILHMILNILFYCLVAFMVYKACTFTYHFSYQIFGRVSVTDTEHKYERQVVINKDESLKSVAKKLELYKLVENKYSFYLRAKLAKEKIQAGTFILSSDMDYDEILATITNATMNVENKGTATPTKQP